VVGFINTVANYTGDPLPGFQSYIGAEYIVSPAKAGAQSSFSWTPAFAGETAGRDARPTKASNTPSGAGVPACEIQGQSPEESHRTITQFTN